MSPELLLQWVGITGPPVDCEALAETLDIVIAFDDLGRYATVLATNELHAGILVNSGADRSTQRFGVAHQIGHLVLHDGVEFRQDRESEDAIDIEADLYATRLLMPAAWLEAALTRGGSVEELAARFGVSTTALTARLRAIRPAQAASE